MAKRVSIINFKGGVGKTVLAFHMATALERFYQAKVLLVDVDHQSSLSIVCMRASGWDAAVDNKLTVNTVFRNLMDGKSAPGTEIIHTGPIRRRLYPNLDLVPSALELDDTEIELSGFSTGNAIQSEWRKRTALCHWLDVTGVDEYYDYIIFDCPPATKIVSQNAIAASHGFIVPVVPEAVMERGAPHLVELVRNNIDEKLNALAKFGEPRATYVPTTRVLSIVITRIQVSAGSSGYTIDHTQHLQALIRRWGDKLASPYIEQGIGISESLTSGVPVFDRADTQNVGKKNRDVRYRELVDDLKQRMDVL